MRKFKTILVLLLTAALISAGAALPNIVSLLIDNATIGKAGSSPILPVQLEFRGNEQRESDDSMWKLALQQNMSTIPITANETTLTEEEVYAAAEQAMEQYVSAGVFQWFDATYRSAQPYIGIDPDDTENFIVFWTVSFVNEFEPYQNLFLHIDDETGKTLYIKNDVYGSFEINTAFEHNRWLMDAFTSIYFQQLGLTKTADYVTSFEELQLDGEVLCVRYTLEDIEYGEITIEFYVTGAGGFEIYFPE